MTRVRFCATNGTVRRYPPPVMHSCSDVIASRWALVRRLLRVRASWWALACGLGLLIHGAAAAQPLGNTMVVPLGAPDARAAFAVADSLEAQLVERRAPLIPLHDARDRFTAYSRPPLMASDSDLDVLAREARQAIEHVAFGRTLAAQRSVREVITRAERTLESLNRETARARQLLDTCLSLVRSELHENRRQEAIEQAAACRRLVPDLAPSEAAHPPNVIGVLAEADDLMRRMRTGRLSVSSVPEQACSVFLNGRHLGTTPFVLDRASSGEYRVQVECGLGLPGRVHVVQLGDQPVGLTVDSAFDRAVSSEPRLSLGYPAAAELREHATQHATLLGQQTHAEDVILVRVEGESAELLRVRVRTGRLMARATVSLEGEGAERKVAWSSALAALVEGRIEGPASVAVAEPANLRSLAQGRASTKSPDRQAPPPTVLTQEPAREESPAPVSSSNDQQARRLRRTGYALAVAAGGLFVTGLALDLKAHSLQRELVSAGAVAQLADKNAQYDRLAAASWLGLASGPLGLAASVLLVRPQPHVPWWSYGVGGLGAGLVAVAVFELASADTCELSRSQGGCLITKSSGRRGGLLLAAALPLFSVPLLHLLRRAQPSAPPNVGVSSEYLSHGALLRLHARF